MRANEVRCRQGWWAQQMRAVREADVFLGVSAVNNTVKTHRLWTLVFTSLWPCLRGLLALPAVLICVRQNARQQIPHPVSPSSCLLSSARILTWVVSWDPLSAWGLDLQTLPNSGWGCWLLAEAAAEWLHGHLGSSGAKENCIQSFAASLIDLMLLPVSLRTTMLTKRPVVLNISSLGTLFQLHLVVASFWFLDVGFLFW